MSNYTKFVNFAAKDDLLPNDPDKVIKGSEFDAEFVAIQAAITSKANTSSPALTGAPTVPTAALGITLLKLLTQLLLFERLTVLLPLVLRV